MIDVNLKQAFDVTLAKSKFSSALNFCNENEIPRSSIRYIQEGSNQIKWSTLNKIAEGFGVDVIQFLKNGVVEK